MAESGKRSKAVQVVVKEIREESGGTRLSMYGHNFVIRPPKIHKPYTVMALRIEGRTALTGPTSPTLDAYMAMIDARMRAGKIDKKVHDKLMEQIRGKQVDRMESDETGDASGKIVSEVISASVHMFARDQEGCLGLEGRTLRAALRECFSRTGYFKTNRGSREEFSLGVGVRPWFLRIIRDGKPLMEADDVGSHPVHVWVGPVKHHSITQYEMISPPWAVEAMIEIRPDSPLKPDHVEEVLSLLPTVCLGAQRSMGFGSCELRGVSEPQ